MANRRTKRKPGRPRKPDAEKRRPRFGIWVTDAEADEIQRKAEAVGLAPAVFLRRVALDKRIRPIPKIPTVNGETYLELGRFGGALNQLMRAFHRGDRVHGITPAFLEHGVNLVREVRHCLITNTAPTANEDEDTTTNPVR